ncbi:hypothetical protein BASA82_000865 [Batrachochytrium salamandrivorans]|nr:hypothetical protein BASA82_000865 [Batrachochytrium salamandrivorans]
MVADAECIGDNLDPIGICTDMDHRHGPPNNTMMDTGVVLSNGVGRVYSNSTMQLDSTSFPEIAVGVGCVGGNPDTNGGQADTQCGNTTMTAAGVILSAKICSNGPTREHYIRQFDISRVGGDRCKACKDVQAYDGGHLLDTLTSAVDYVERHQGNSIYEQDETRPIWVQSKKPANTLATAGDTMLTDDELKVVAYIVSSLRVVRPV